MFKNLAQTDARLILSNLKKNWLVKIWFANFTFFIKTLVKIFILKSGFLILSERIPCLNFFFSNRKSDNLFKSKKVLNQ